MTQYNTLNVKFSNSQLNKLKSGIKNETKVTLNLSSNLIENSNDGTNFPYKFLLTDTPVSKICKAFINGSSANITFSKAQLSKILQLGGFLLVPPIIFDLPIKEIRSSRNSVKNLFGKELMNKIPKEINSKLLLDTGLNLIGKKFEK